MKKLLFAFNIIAAFFLFTYCQQRKPVEPDKIVAAATDEGKKLFGDNCSRCHLEAGNGGQNGETGITAPDIRKSTKTQAELVAFISNGWGKMPSFKDSIPDETIAKIATYVATHVEQHVSDKPSSTSKILTQ